MKLLSGMIDDGAAAVLGGVHAVDVRCWCVVGPAPECRFHRGNAQKRSRKYEQVKSVEIKRLRSKVKATTGHETIAWRN